MARVRFSRLDGPRTPQTAKTHHFHLTRNGVKEVLCLRKDKGFTTMVDLAEFEKTTWAFLVNIKMTWQYDGMAYLFREAESHFTASTAERRR